MTQITASKLEERVTEIAGRRRVSADCIKEVAAGATNNVIKIEKKEEEIKLLDKKLEEVAKFTKLLTDFQKTSDSLRNGFDPAGVGEEQVFNYRITTLTSSNQGTYPAVNYATTGANRYCVPAQYTLTISSIALAETTVYTGFTSVTSSVVTGAAGRFSAGTFTINSQSVTIVASDTLPSIAAKINSLNSLTGVSATIQYNSPNYSLRISSDTTGVANDYTITDTSNVLSLLTVDPINSRSAADSSFTFNGQSSISTYNTVTNLLYEQNFELNLLQATPPGLTIYININADIERTQIAIENFMAIYNLIRIFAYEQTDRDSNFKYKETALLQNDPEFVRVLTDLSSILTSSVDGISSSAPYQSLGDLGIIVTDSKGNLGDEKSKPGKNILAYKNNDPSTLQAALNNDLSAVKNIFGFSYTSSSSNLKIVKTSNKISTTSFTLDIDVSRSNVLINGNSIQDKARVIAGGITYRPNFVQVSSTYNKIEGQSGSPIEGMKMVYSGSGTETITVTLSQGIADKIYNILATQTESMMGMVEVDSLVKGQKQYDSNGNVIKQQAPASFGMLNYAKRYNSQEIENNKQLEKNKKDLETKVHKLFDKCEQNRGTKEKAEREKKASEMRFQAEFSNK